MKIFQSSPFLFVACGVIAHITAAISPLHAAPGEAPKDNVELVSEVDSCRTWRVKDDMGQGNNYARLEGRTVYFTKCSASADTSEQAAPIQGEVPENATAVAEADGCRVWRVSDGEGRIEAAAMLEPRYLYFTKCGNMTVPTIESGMR
jgi:hypothetical protein